MLIVSYCHLRWFMLSTSSARCSTATTVITRCFSTTLRTACFTRRSSRSWLAFATGLMFINIDITSGFRRGAAASLTPTRFDTRGSLRDRLALDSRLVVLLARMTSGCRRDAHISLTATRFASTPSTCSVTWGSFGDWVGMIFVAMDDTWPAASHTAFHFA